MERSTENVIEWLTGDRRAVLTLSQTKYINRIRKLCDKHPDDVILLENDDGSVYASIPLAWVKLASPRQISDEQRAALKERMASLKTQ